MLACSNSATDNLLKPKSLKKKKKTTNHKRFELSRIIRSHGISWAISGFLEGSFGVWLKSKVHKISAGSPFSQKDISP